MGCQSHALPLPGQQSKTTRYLKKKTRQKMYGQICVALKDIKRGTLVSCHDLGRMNFFKKGFGKMQKVGEIVAESVVDYDDPSIPIPKNGKKRIKILRVGMLKTRECNIRKLVWKNLMLVTICLKHFKFDFKKNNVMKCRLPIFIVYLLSYYLKKQIGTLKSIYNMENGNLHNHGGREG